MILRLPKGYDTVIGMAGGVLSGGQRQRVGLARAIYGRPKLVVLDEPNSNLDDQGEKELVNALRHVKAYGCTVILITHKAALLQNVDKIMILQNGVVAKIGPAEQILGKIVPPTAKLQAKAN